MSINRFNSTRSPNQKTGTDKIFGLGSDGNVTIAANTSLSRDMYYNTLTVNANTILFTNGFKVFVKENLINNGTIGMPSNISQTTTILQGTVLTRIDGSAGYISQDAVSGSLTLAEVKNFDSLIEAIMQKEANRRKWFAGSAGTPGTSGTANPGGGGGANAGVAGTGGSGGLGGGMVVVLAKSISGTGVFVSQGTSGTAGNPGSNGNSVSGTQGHNPTGHAHNPTGHAHNPTGHAHNPPGHSHNPPGHDHNPPGHAHNPPGHFHHPDHQTPGNCQHEPMYESICFAHHPTHHNPSHQHTNPGNQFSHPGNQFSHPGNQFSHPGNQFSHPGNQFSHPGNQFSHPGNSFHNPSYAGGTGNPGNPGNQGNAGTVSVLSRGITTHIASSNFTYVEDLDE
jgi:tetraspanin-3/YLP motif-containing protein 1